MKCYNSLFPLLKCILLSIAIISSTIACKKDEENNNEKPDIPIPTTIIDTTKNDTQLYSQIENSIIIPIGQLTKKGSSVDIFINNKQFIYDTLDDRLGGFWAIIPDSSFTETRSNLNIKITKRNTELILFERTNDSTNAYLKSSEYINWDNTDIIKTANGLYDQQATNTENAIAFQEFVIDYVSFDNTYSNQFGIFSAQKTFADKKGVCINFSRLFIALCRAKGIPARSVSGVVFDKGNVGEDCLGHHQWCEFLDENNKWHSLNLTFTTNIDFTSADYIDFTYCAEETELFANYYEEFHADLGKPFTTDNNCKILYCYLPTKPQAKFGFKLLHKSLPDSIVFEKTVIVNKSGSTINFSE